MHFRTKFSSAIISLWVLLAVLVTVEASTVWDGDLEAPPEMLEINFRKQFEVINKFLIEKLPESNELDTNMKKAEEWYNELLSERKMRNSLNKGFLTGNASRSKMIRALRLFLALGKLGGKDQCNMDSYKTLLQNDVSAGGKSHQLMREADLDQLNRVQRIIHDASLKHAESCYFRYPELLKEIYYKMDQAEIDQVSQLFDDYIHSQMEEGRKSDSEKIYNRFVFQPEALGSWNFARAFYENTPDLPKHSPSSNRVLYLLEKKGIKKTKALQLYKERVLAPCRSYVDKLKGVFIPARYDAVFHNEENDDEYYMSWARFRLCNGLIGIKDSQIINKVSTIHKEVSSKLSESD